MTTTSKRTALLIIVLFALASACATLQTDRDKTRRGAGIGAAAGAVLGAVVGEGEADEILAGAAIGAGIGAGVGNYMDRQEERLAQIPGTTVERVDENMLLVHFDSDVLFDVDSADLDDDGYRTLNKVSDTLVEFKKTAVVVQGHTDSTGSDQHNQRLSERRAESVVRYLMDQGIARERITAVGYGEQHPVASNETAAGRSKNRRVDILLKAKVR